MYHNFIDYPQNKVKVAKRVRMATGDEVPTSQTWFQKNQKAIMVVGAVIIVGLLIIPDAYIRKYVPWVK
jgi:hypothetical protein